MSPITEPDVKISLIRLFRRTSPRFRIGCEYSFVIILAPHLGVVYFTPPQNELF